MERDLRITGTWRGQSSNHQAPPGFEVSNPWKVQRCRLCFVLVTGMLIQPTGRETDLLGQTSHCKVLLSRSIFLPAFRCSLTNIHNHATASENRCIIAITRLIPFPGSSIRPFSSKLRSQAADTLDLVLAKMHVKVLCQGFDSVLFILERPQGLCLPVHSPLDLLP